MSDNAPPKVIYDLGANTGDDLAYYLLKADRVVAVEANPQLAQMIRDRYPEEIASGRLTVENCVVIAGPGGDPVPFYINRRSHLASRFVKPAYGPEVDSDPALYDEVFLPSIGVCDLISRHGPPHYLKMDLEFYDAEVLKELFSHGIFPESLSVESHNINIFSILVAMGGYTSFKLVEGSQVGFKFANHPIITPDGPAVFSFPHHAAGPFGDDLPGVWRDPNSFFRHLAVSRLGWKDIHASRIHTAIPKETLVDYVLREHTPKGLRWLVRGVLNFANRMSLRLRRWPAYETSLPSAKSGDAS